MSNEAISRLKPISQRLSEAVCWLEQVKLNYRFQRHIYEGLAEVYWLLRDLKAEGEAAETRAVVNIAAWKCKHCGCLWRDNLDGTVSLFDAQQQSCRECEESTPHACVIHWIEMAETRAVLPAQNMEEWVGRSPIDATYDPVLPQCYVDDITAPLVVCERCQMRLPEQLVTFGVGVRGGTVARCAACAPQPGPEGDAKRAEVIALRKAKRALSPDTDTAPSQETAKDKER